MLTYFCRKELTRGGVVIYVRNETIAVELDVSNITVERLCECVTVRLKNNTVIMCVYRSPKTSIPNFLNHFNECLGFIVSNSTKAVICGDFNINLLSENKYSTDFRNLLASYGFNTAINAPTRLGKGCESAIDILVTNYEPKKYSCSTVEVGLSDHTLQCMIIKEKLPPRKKCFTFKRVITSASMKAFCDNLCYVNWECVYCCDNVNVMYDNFIQIFQSLFEKCFKPRKVYLNNQGSLYHVNPRINQLSQQNIAYHKLMKSTSDPVMIQICKQYRKFYKAEVATMKKKLNANFIENSSNKCKAMWSVINKELGRASLTQENIVIKKGDMILTNPVHIANTFNSYYIHSVQSLVSSTLDLNCKFPSQSGSIVFSPLSETEVLNIVLRMKTKSSSGLDGIPSSVVKQSVNFIIKPLTFIINSSFASETNFALQLKGWRENMENFCGSKPPEGGCGSRQAQGFYPLWQPTASVFHGNRRFADCDPIAQFDRFDPRTTIGLPLEVRAVSRALDFLIPVSEALPQRGTRDSNPQPRVPTRSQNRKRPNAQSHQANGGTK
ncbi:Lipoprotein signal peptidase [Frankliniella fusca]|uniref:Lipoprotein signal peptidase n=1 Tax=Frankliniella fusca TaxID=407009 RepID=A0AAE1GW03_9NEOP|nr:Lipoprotein signal peptidase [Frankliniella fusca]